MRKVWEYFTAKDWRTWVGHALLGGAIAFLLKLVLTHPLMPAQAIVLAVFIAFVYREASDAINRWLLFRDVVKLGEREAETSEFIDMAKSHQRATPMTGRWVVDGFVDLWAPVLAAILVVSLL